MLSSFWEAVKIAFAVVGNIVLEWWIVFLFLLSAELALGFWVLWLIDFKREVVGPLVLMSLILFVGVPLRERYFVEDNSILQRSSDWMREKVKKISTGYR